MNDKQTLTLEAGKYYRTRDGRKAYVAGISPFASTSDICSVTGFIDGNKGEISWRRDGVWLNREDDNDLVAEWVEPKRIKAWMTITDSAGGVKTHGGHYFAGSVTLGHTKEEALAFACDNVIACIEIDVLEGHGLNGGGCVMGLTTVNFQKEDPKIMEDLYQKAVTLVREEGRASPSFVQRKLMIGCNRAWDLMDMMQERGVVSAPNHVGKREVLK